MYIYNFFNHVNFICCSSSSVEQRQNANFALLSAVRQKYGKRSFYPMEYRHKYNIYYCPLERSSNNTIKWYETCYTNFLLRFFEEIWICSYVILPPNYILCNWYHYSRVSVYSCISHICIPLIVILKFLNKFWCLLFYAYRLRMGVIRKLCFP